MILTCSWLPPDLLGVEPQHSFVVGDSIWDLLAVQRAGSLGVGLLSGGYGRLPSFKQRGIPRSTTTRPTCWPASTNSASGPVRSDSAGVTAHRNDSAPG